MDRDYDAKAIAEVMGIAFVAVDKVAPSVQTNTKATAGHALIPDFIIQVDNTRMHVVEIKGKESLVAFSNLKPRLRNKIWLDRCTIPSQVFIEKIVEYGLPRKVLRHVVDNIAGGDKAKVASLEHGVVPKTTLERRTRLSTEESERTERIARLFVHATRALGTEDEAREFMMSVHPELDGRSPVEAAKTDLGTRRVESILNALEFGLAL